MQIQHRVLLAITLAALLAFAIAAPHLHEAYAAASLLAEQKAEVSATVKCFESHASAKAVDAVSAYLGSDPESEARAARARNGELVFADSKDLNRTVVPGMATSRELEALVLVRNTALLACPGLVKDAAQFRDELPNLQQFGLTLLRSLPDIQTRISQSLRNVAADAADRAAAARVKEEADEIARTKLFERENAWLLKQ